MGIEIEVKIKLDKSEETLLRNWLKANAKQDSVENHLEYYLNNPNNTFFIKNKNGFVDAENYMRVRFLNNNKAQVNLKRFKIDQDTNKSENIGEFEFYTDNANNTLTFFKELGYSDCTMVKKDREIYTHSQFEIVIDKVEGLGTFAEFELKEFDSKTETKLLYRQVFEFIKSLGFKQIKEQKRGYVSMLWNPNKDFTSLRDL